MDPYQEVMGNQEGEEEVQEGLVVLGEVAWEAYLFSPLLMIPGVVEEVLPWAQVDEEEEDLMVHEAQAFHREVLLFLGVAVVALVALVLSCLEEEVVRVA